MYIMTFQYFLENYCGIGGNIVLAVLLSQLYYFHLLTKTPLGRIALLAIIICISHCNHMLGLLSVFIVIVAFNHFQFREYEGFDTSGNALAVNVIKDKQTILNAKKNILDEKLAYLQQQSATNTTTTSNSSAGTEGFCMTDRETTILRGKKSNTIPVFNSREKKDNIDPADKSVFSSSFYLVK